MTKKVRRGFRTGSSYRVVETEEGITPSYEKAERTFVVRFNQVLQDLEASSKAKRVAREVVCEDFDLPLERKDDMLAFVSATDTSCVKVKLFPTGWFGKPID